MNAARELMLDAFQRLFVKTASKLQISYTPEDLQTAKEAFSERLEKVADALNSLPFDVAPPEVVQAMEAALDQISPAQVVGQLAALPLLQHTQLVLQTLALRAAQQKLLESALEQADTTYGGN